MDFVESILKESRVRYQRISLQFALADLAHCGQSTHGVVRRVVAIRDS